MTTPPRTPATAAALRHRDEYAPRVVRSPAEWDAFVGSLALIEAEARASQAEYDFVSGPGIPPHQCAPLNVERLREAVDAALFDAEMDDSHPGCRAKWRRVAMGAFAIAALEEPTPGPQYTEDDPDWSAMVSPISDTDGGHDDR